MSKTQTAISARIDNETLWMMDQYCMGGGMKRNRIINEGARLWLDLQERRRLYRFNVDQATREKILAGFLDVWFPEPRIYPGGAEIKWIGDEVHNDH